MSSSDLRIGSIVMSVLDLERMLAFWSAALDYEPRYPPEAGWVLLGPRDGRSGPNIGMDVRVSTVSEPPRLHLDLYTADQLGEVERLLALGATRFPERNRPDDADYVILCDPEGNRFCVIDGGG